jgi:DNA-binding NarL/FixJ family response regulator
MDTPKRPAPIKTGTCWIVEDQTMFRQLLHAVVVDSGLFSVIKEFADAESLVASYAKETPALVMADLLLPNMNGLDLIQLLIRRNPTPRILVVSDRLEAMFIRQTLSLGANGFICKSASVDELKTAIQHVMNGHTFICSLSSAKLRTSLLSPEGNMVEMLTKQERQVLKLYAEGHPAKEIAFLLKISAGTASNHLTSIKQKLGVADGVALVRFATQHGLVPPLR